MTMDIIKDRSVCTLDISESDRYPLSTAVLTIVNTDYSYSKSVGNDFIETDKGYSIFLYIFLTELFTDMKKHGIDPEEYINMGEYEEIRKRAHNGEHRGKDERA